MYWREKSAQTSGFVRRKNKLNDCQNRGNNRWEKKSQLVALEPKWIE